MSNQHDSFADRIIEDLIRAIKIDPSLTSFEIIPTPLNDNKNSSPVLRGDETLGLESWVLRYVLPYAHRQVLDPLLRKDPEKLIPFLWAVNLLNPDMPTAWGRRRDLILRRKLSSKEELRLTRMTLSRKPKCNEALAHRRWLISQSLIPGDNMSVLREELDLVDMIADRYHSNYHAWTHRQWVMQNLVPIASKERQSSTLLSEFGKRDMCDLFSSSLVSLYLTELETNLHFASTHVSDHSGLHYRKFLISQLFLLFRNYEKPSFRQDTHTASDGENGKQALLFYNSIKQNLKKFLTYQNLGDNIIFEYIASLEVNLTIYDIVVSILVSELNTNTSLNNLFVDHEALWTFRRFLIHSFQSIAEEFKAVCSNSNVTVNHKEGAHLGYGKYVDIADCLVSCLARNEETVIKSFQGQSSVTTYSNWLSKFSHLPLNF